MIVNDLRHNLQKRYFKFSGNLNKVENMYYNLEKLI